MPGSDKLATKAIFYGRVLARSDSDGCDSAMTESRVFRIIHRTNDVIANGIGGMSSRFYLRRYRTVSCLGRCTC